MGADRDNLENHNTLEHDAQVRLAEWAETLRRAAREAASHEGRAPRRRATTTPEMFAGVRDDDDAFAFLRSLLDTVMGAGDPFAAALGLRDAAAHLPASLPLLDRVAVRAGSLASIGLPWAVLPIARKWLRERVSGAVWSQRFPTSGSDRGAASGLRDVVSQHTAQGCETVLLLTGDAVLGAEGVATEVGRLSWLAEHSGVRHVAVDPQRIVTGLTPWSDDADAETAAQTLRPLLEVAARHGVSVTLRPHSYHGAMLAPEILVRAFADTDFAAVQPGIWLPAELPESGAIADRLIRWSRARVREGGAPLTVTIGHTGTAGAEHVSSLLTGLAVPTLPTTTERDTHLIRLGLLVSGAAQKGDLRVVCASEDPHILAIAESAARTRVEGEPFAMQLRAGVAEELVQALTTTPDASGTTPTVRIELPITSETEHEGLLDTLVALAAEACDAESSLAQSAEFVALSASTDHPAAAVALGTVLPDDAPFPVSHRTQRREREGDPTERDSPLFYRPSSDTETFDTGGLTAAVLGLTRGSTGKIVREPIMRALPVPAISRTGWANEPITDALVSENREWMRRKLRAAHDLRQSWQHDPQLPDTHFADPTDPQLVAELLAAGQPWSALRPIDRSVLVRRLALGVAAARDAFFTVLAAESGAPVSVLDTEINGAIDAARSLAPQAAALGSVRGAEFHPDPLALVVIAPGIPLDERAEAILAALAAGSAVLCVVHPSVARSTHLLCAEWEAAGLPPGSVRLVVDTEDGTVAANLAADPRIARALVLGAREDALQLLRVRPALRIEGRFRALGSVAITPSARTGLAVRETVRSAFGAGHRSPHQARALVLLGAAARSDALLAQLEDAVRALRVGDTAADTTGSAATVADPLAFDVGPLVAPPTAAGLRALTELQPGERWLVRPEALDTEWRTWSPGVRVGVKPHSPFWADASGMPVIGVATARTVPEMITLQSQLGGGSVAALFGTDPSEVLPWIDGIYAARITVGHATAPAQVERHPGGGWGGAGMGNELLVGGPHRLLGLGSWRLREGTQSSTLHLRGLSPEVQLLIETAQPELDYRTFDHVRRAALSDALTWHTELGRLTDTMRLEVRQHLVRRRPVRTHVRLAEHAPLGDLVRVLAAALVVNAPLSVSTGVPLPDTLTVFIESLNIPVSLERDDDWLERMAVYGPDPVAAEHPRQPLHHKRIPVSRAISPEADRTIRIRLIGGDPQRTAEWFGVPYATALWAEPVTMAGPLELLAFVREQAISVNGHERGMVSPAPGIQGWIEELDERITLT